MSREKIEHTMSIAFRIILTLMAVVLFIVMVKAITTDHLVRYYYIAGYQSNGSVQIKADIDWDEDKTLTLDRSVTYEEAIEIVTKMNKALPK